jgi:hypothetical protein
LYYEATITLIPKPYKEQKQRERERERENFRPISLMNINAKIIKLLQTEF